jgi:hypothetical protein
MNDDDIPLSLRITVEEVAARIARWQPPPPTSRQQEAESTFRKLAAQRKQEARDRVKKMLEEQAERAASDPEYAAHLERKRQEATDRRRLRAKIARRVKTAARTRRRR